MVSLDIKVAVNRSEQCGHSQTVGSEDGVGFVREVTPFWGFWGSVITNAISRVTEEAMAMGTSCFSGCSCTSGNICSQHSHNPVWFSGRPKASYK